MRPSKLTEELIKQMAAELEIGMPITSACDYLVITQKSHSNWMQQGEQDIENEVDSLYATYFLTIKKSRSTFEHNSLIDIKSGRPGWQGAAWVLERTNQKYMPKQEVVAEEGKVQVVLGGSIKNIKRNDGK